MNEKLVYSNSEITSRQARNDFNADSEREKHVAGVRAARTSLDINDLLERTVTY